MFAAIVLEDVQGQGVVFVLQHSGEEEYWKQDPRAYRFPEEISFGQPTADQMKELEDAWVAAPSGRRLEVVAQLAAEMGVTVLRMSRRRVG